MAFVEVTLQRPRSIRAKHRTPPGRASSCPAHASSFRRAKRPDSHDGEAHLCYYDIRMSALIFMGGLWAVLAGTDATACKPGEQCAVCESCKRNVYKVLR